MYLPKFLQELISALENLPGVGPKTANRYAFHIIQRWSVDMINDLITALNGITKNVCHCQKCNLLTDQAICEICSNSNRDHQKILVVKDTKDVLSIEKSGQYDGAYHVLGGIISLPDGIGPDDLAIDLLEKRINDGVCEIILATGFTPQGEITSLYLEKILQKYPVKVSKIGYGLPAGGDIEYADQLTLKKALESRK